MSETPSIYGFDLITDASDGEIDPFTGSVTAVGLDVDTTLELFDIDEPELLKEIDERLANLAPGILVTWNGSLLDLPLLSVRYATLGISNGLTLTPDRRKAPASPIVGLDFACQAIWHGHRHLDLRRVYERPSRWRVPMRRQADQEESVPPADDFADRDPTKDASLARTLAFRRWAQARKHVDQPRETDFDLTTHLRQVAADADCNVIAM